MTSMVNTLFSKSSLWIAILAIAAIATIALAPDLALASETVYRP